jgi:Caspase domain
MGNGDYRVGPLQNPINDAAAVAEVFEKKLGFDKVNLRTNLSADGFRVALLEFARDSAGADIGVVYFAGHGTEVGGRNFLIPVDAALARAGDLDLEAIALDTVLGQLSGVTRLKLVILDACRNNPFPLSGARRSVGRGLARVEPEGNTLVAYASKDGTTADDGVGRPHSPFTEALLKYVATPGLEIRQLFGYVRDEVAAKTAYQQQPYLYGSLGGPGFFLQPAASAPQAPPLIEQPPTPPQPLLQPQLNEVERAWAIVRDSSNIVVLEAFRRQYGASNALYDQMAAARIEELKTRKPVAALPEAAPAPQAPPTPYQPASATPPTNLVSLLQTELRRVGCEPGAIDDTWGDESEAALAKFARHAKLNIRTDVATPAALEAVKGQQGRICPLVCGSGTVEENGLCVAKPAPPATKSGKSARAPPRVTPPRRTAPTARPAPREREGRPKPGMCWAVDAGGNTNILVPCVDSRTRGMKAY